MNKRIVLTVLLAVLALCGCKKEHRPDAVIATLWDVPLKAEALDEHDLDFGEASRQIELRRQGFLAGLEQFPELKIRELPHTEDQSVEGQMLTIQEMIEEDNVLMIVGATTNTASMHAASTSNFFNLPMLIPYAEGDHLIGEGNYWTRRLTPSGDDFADHLSTHITTVNLKHEIDNILFTDAPVYDYSIDTAIFYEDTTYGESAAVQLGNMLMDNQINIEIYEKYDRDSFNSKMQELKTSSREKFTGIDLVFFINEDSEYAQNLADVYDSVSVTTTRPVMIFIGSLMPEYTEQTVESGQIFFIHRMIDESSCPANISSTEAIGYGTGILTGRILERTMQNLPAWPKLSEALQSNQTQEMLYMERVRSVVRTQMTLFNEDVPCIGRVSFGSNGANKSLQLETVTFMANGVSRVVSDAEIVNLIAQKVRYDLDNIND